MQIVVDGEIVSLYGRSMEPDNDIELAKLQAVLSRILEDLAKVEKQLPLEKKHSTSRRLLLDEKTDLLNRLRRQKMLIVQAKSRVADRLREEPITDHAAVRWLERKHGIDIGKLKAMMLTDGLVEALKHRAAYWTDGEVYFMLSEKRVTTVLTHSQFWNKQK